MRFDDVVPPLDQNRLRWDSAPDSLLGQGSFGIVYKGTWNGSPVAIKVVKPARVETHSEEYKAAESAAMKQHRREIHRLQVVRNPFIIQYLGVFRGANPRDLYIVTEFLEGGSLFDSLTKMRAREAVLDDRSFLQVASHMAYGLCHVHSQQYTHGDMKPQNVLLTAAFSFEESDAAQVHASFAPSDKAKIADFGLSKRLKGAGPTGLLESTAATADFGNGPCGTFLYMSPEAYDGVSQLTDDQAKAADVYAYGLILFELLSGIQSWGVEHVRNPMQLHKLVCAGQRPSWGAKKPAVRSEFLDLVERCWSQEPQGRPTFDEIVDELGVLQGRLGESGTLSSFDPYSALGAAEGSGQTESLKGQQLLGTDQVDPSYCRNDPNCNSRLDGNDIPYLSDTFFAGIGSEASSDPTIRRVSSVRLADSVTGINANQRRPSAAVDMQGPGFNESYNSRRVMGLAEPQILPQYDRSEDASWPIGTDSFPENGLDCVDQQGEMDGSVIGGVPVKRVQSTYNVGQPEIEPLHISANSGCRPTMGLGSVAGADQQLRKTRRSDGDLFASWFGVSLDPFCAGRAGVVNHVNNIHPNDTSAIQVGAVSADPHNTLTNGQVQLGTEPAPPSHMAAHEAGALGDPRVKEGNEHNPDIANPVLPFPISSNGHRYEERLRIATDGSQRIQGSLTENRVPMGQDPMEPTVRTAYGALSTSSSLTGLSSAPQSSPSTYPKPPMKPRINSFKGFVQSSRTEPVDADFSKWQTRPYGSGSLSAGFMPLNSSPIHSPEFADVNAVRLVLQRPDGRDRVISMWSRGHLHTVAGGLARAHNLRGGEMLRLACDFLKQSTPDKLEPVVARDLCTCIGTIARNDSDTLGPELILMAVRVALSTMFTHHTSFLQNDIRSVEAYVACNFALSNLFRVHNVISDASFRADIAEWISFTISWNVHEGPPHGPFSEALGYAATSAARNFMWMNEDNLTAFTSEGRGGGRRPTFQLLWSVAYFDWVGSSPVVETSLSALAMIIHEPKQREDFAERQGLKTLTNVLGRHKSNLRITKLVFAAIAMLFSEMHAGSDQLDVVRKGFLFDDGCQRLVSALDEVKSIPVDPRLIMTTVEAGCDALLAIAVLCDELRARVVRCGAVTTILNISKWLLAYDKKHFRDARDPELFVLFTILGRSICTLAQELSKDCDCARLLEETGTLASLEELTRKIANS